MQSTALGSTVIGASQHCKQQKQAGNGHHNLKHSRCLLSKESLFLC